MKDGDRFIRQLNERAQIRHRELEGIIGIFFNLTTPYTPDWLYWTEYGKANQN
jgi:hypothetical protein